MNKICRICLEEGVLSSIFARNYNVSLSEMIEYCSGIRIFKDDGLPEQLCSNCAYKLGIAYHFKQTCESSDLRLRQYLGLHTKNRYNDVAVMTDPINISTNVTIRKCKCKMIISRKTHTNYKKKLESEKLKRGPKPKPKQEHTCIQCEKQFKCQAQLEMHIRTHTGDKPFVCMYCPRRFTQKHNLTIHLRIHTGEKPFQCEVCSKTFSAQGNLQTHLKIHTGQRDHICSLCSKSFITSSELTRHMSKHRGVKGNKCDICGVAFVQSRDLKLHKQKKHHIGVTSVTLPEVTHKNNHNESQPEKNLVLSSENIHIAPMHTDIPKGILNPVTPKLEHNQTNLREDEKTKQLRINQYEMHRIQKHVCAICGEEFDYLSILAQHYSLRHETYKPLLC